MIVEPRNVVLKVTASVYVTIPVTQGFVEDGGYADIHDELKAAKSDEECAVIMMHHDIEELGIGDIIEDGTYDYSIEVIK